MSSDPSCPSPEALADLRANRLPPPQAATLRGHIAACARCQGRASRGAADPFPFLEPSKGPDELGRLANYSVRGILGAGGMAIVFDAYDESLQREVALKVMRPDQASSEMRQRFLAEARALASLPHDNIVAVYAVGEAGLPFIAMERLRGETLETRIRHEGSLPLDESLSFARQIAAGLAPAHEKGMVHRDIKPANIWIEQTPDGRSRHVKLLDFGIARRADQAKELPGSDPIMGTPAHMAPEQALGQEVDGKADLYSLGCVLYQMVTGQPAFPGKEGETAAVLQAVVKGEAPRVTWKVPSLPPPVAQLIQDLMNREPADRPASAAEVISRLGEIDEKLASGVPAPVPETPGLARRPSFLPMAVGGGVVLLAAVVGLVAAWGRLWNPSENPVPTPPPKGEPIIVGILHSTTGPLSVHEKPVLHATHFAIKEINKAGGVLGRPLKFEQADGASKPAMFAERAASLIDKKKAVVLFGCWSSPSRIAVADVCTKKDRLLFYPASYEGLGQKPSVVYLGGTPNQSLVPLVKWAYTDLGVRRFFLLGSQNIYSHTVHEILRHEIKELGGTVAGEKFVLVDETNFDPVADEIEKAKPKFLVNTIDGQGNAALARALRRRKLTPATMHTAWTAVGEAELSMFHAEEVVGDYSSSGYFESWSSKANRAFVARYHKDFPSERVNDSMQTAYAGVFLWKAAVEKAGTTDSAAVRKALQQLSVESPEGVLKLDDKLHAYRRPHIGKIIVEDGLTQFHEVLATRQTIKAVPFPAWRTKKEWEEFLDKLFEEWSGKWEQHR